MGNPIRSYVLPARIQFQILHLSIEFSEQVKIRQNPQARATRKFLGSPFAATHTSGSASLFFSA
jgi:hypothetical protein